MDNLQVVINHYGDREMLEGTLDSVTTRLPETPVLVADGRYANFGSEDLPDLTPGTENLCRDYETVEYHNPEPERLPFGSNVDREAFGRSPIHEKAKWLWYEVADPEKWSLKIDSDERLHEFSVDEETLDDLDPTQKCLVELVMGRAERVQNARVWVPKHWTFYVDDICFPRDVVPRSNPFEKQREKVNPEFTWIEVEKYELVEPVTVRNLGHKRTEEYTERREGVKSEIAEFALK